MNSTAHLPKIYRCPAESLGLLGSHKNHAERRFPVFSALTVHLETKACAADGLAVIQKALGFLETRMKALGAPGLASMAVEVQKTIERGTLYV